MKPLPVTLLIVEDDESVRRLLRTALTGRVEHIVEASDGQDALSLLERTPPDLLVTDLRMPRLDGLALIERVLERSPLTPVIVVTGQGDAATAVEAMKRGASDYLTKPVDAADFRDRVEAVIRTRVLPRRVAFVSRFLPAGEGRLLVTCSPRMRAVLETIGMVRGRRSNVLIQGETGTGKEVVARAIHGDAAAGRPFVAVNCAGIPEGLLESQLFGHVKGSFTGATSDAPGLFVAASGGTLFLDEITEVPIHLQSKLLRAIQEREVLPVGGTVPVKIDARILSATNRPMQDALREEKLREDLFYRLAVVPILLPPLRERKEDIPVLAAYFSSRFAQENDGREKAFTAAALDRLIAHPWPGNVRELQNVVERVYATCPEEVVDARHLSLALPQSGMQHSTREGSLPSWEEVERGLIKQALALAAGNRSETSRLLKIDRKRLLRKMKKYGLDSPAETTGPDTK